jgi:hypothetical protein
MTWKRLILVAALATPIVLASQPSGAGRADLAIVGGSVVDVVTGRLLPGKTVLVTRGRIVALLDAGATYPRPGRVISATGKFVIPGLWDMHVEQALPLWDKAPVDSNASYFFPLFLAHGVTGVRDVAGSIDVLRRWGGELESGTRVGPRLVFTGPKLGKKDSDSPAFDLPTPRALEQVLDSLNRVGASDAYVMEVPRDFYPTLAAGSARNTLPFGGLVPLSVSMAEAVGYGHRLVEHMSGVMIAASDREARVRWRLQVSERRPLWARLLWKFGIWKRVENAASFVAARHSAAAESTLVALLKARNVYQVPTLRLLANADRAGDDILRVDDLTLQLRFPAASATGYWATPLPDGDPRLEGHATMRRMIGAMTRAGVPILAGSDPPNMGSVPGRSLHDELVLLVRSGLTPAEALRSATLRPAEFLGATDSLGTIAPGKVADLVILDANPLEAIDNIRGVRAVMARGQFHDRSDLDGMISRARLAAAPISAYWRERDRK